MKKIVLVLFAFLFGAVSFAGNTVTVVNGKDALKTAYADKSVGTLEIDWSHAQYDHGKSMKEYWAEQYDYFVKTCSDNFKKGFDEVSKGLKLGKDGQAKYKILIKVDNLDRYVNVMNIVPGMTVKVWGTVIVSTVSGEKIAEIEVDSMKGNRDFSPQDAFGKAFYILGKRVAKMK